MSDGMETCHELRRKVMAYVGEYFAPLMQQRDEEDGARPLTMFSEVVSPPISRCPVIALGLLLAPRRGAVRRDVVKLLHRLSQGQNLGSRERASQPIASLGISRKRGPDQRRPSGNG